MITVQLDENKYFTGSYAKIGSIPGGVKVSALPEDLSNNKTTCWKWDTYQVDVEVIVPAINEEAEECETQIVKQDVTGWIFDEAKHAAILKEISEFVPEQTNEEKIAELEEKNASLEATMDLLLTDIIPGLMGL